MEEMILEGITSNLEAGNVSFMNTDFASMGMPMIIFWIVVMIFEIFCSWKMFEKAWVAGRKCLIPIYNLVCYFRICGMSGRRVLWCWLIVPVIVSYFKLAKKFGKGTGFWLGLTFFSAIFVPILALGSAKYQTESKE